MTYDCPETPEDIRNIRKKYRDERYRREDPRKAKLDYSTIKPNDLQTYISNQSAKNSVSIPEPNTSLLPNTEKTILLNRSKSAVGPQRHSASPQNSTAEEIQAIQQPITIIYNNYQVPNQSTINPTPEFLAKLATNIAANNAEKFTESKENDSIDKNVEENNQEAKNPNETKDWLNNEWDKYYGYNSNKNRTDSRLSTKSKTPSPTLNELNDRLVS